MKIQKMKRIGRMVDVLNCFERMKFMKRIVKGNLNIKIDFLLKIFLGKSHRSRSKITGR
ncbi:MAG: hypothetical protein U5L09_02575 [Bacteroidales bacterium]|nr:hypothetical protein [Bacteroidales bacterium]